MAVTVLIMLPLFNADESLYAIALITGPSLSGVHSQNVSGERLKTLTNLFYSLSCENSITTASEVLSTRRHKVLLSLKVNYQNPIVLTAFGRTRLLASCKAS